MQIYGAENTASLNPDYLRVTLRVVNNLLIFSLLHKLTPVDRGMDVGVCSSILFCISAGESNVSKYGSRTEYNVSRTENP